jgi:uncharacterized UPF0160 family protein
MIINKRQLVTHNGSFHADEVAAVALLHLYGMIDYLELDLIRTREIEIINQADIVLDVGGIHDPANLRFDHHQIKNGEISTAGLVWDWLKQQTGEMNGEIENLINAIDKHDCGVAKMPDFSFAQIIGSYNHSDLFDESKQQVAFNDAVKIAITFIGSLMIKQQQLIQTTKIIEDSMVRRIGNHKILVLKEYAPNWPALVHGGGQYASITHVIWYVKEKNGWCVQIPAVKENSFVLAHPRLVADDNAIFIHQNGFFGVYASKEAILNMLRLSDEVLPNH